MMEIAGTQVRMWNFDFSHPILDGYAATSQGEEADESSSNAMVFESSHPQSCYGWFLWMMAASRPASSTPAKIFLLHVVLRDKSTGPASTSSTTDASPLLPACLRRTDLPWHSICRFGASIKIDKHFVLC